MARDSRRVRKIRRIKRERSLAFKMVAFALQQRDQARMIASALEEELKKYVKPEEPKLPGVNAVADLLEKETPVVGG